MKILFLLLDHHSVKDKSKACQNTWLKNIGKEDEVIFLGDPLMPDFINGHEVYKPLPNEKKQEQNRNIIGFWYFTIQSQKKKVMFQENDKGFKRL